MAIRLMRIYTLPKASTTILWSLTDTRSSLLKTTQQFSPTTTFPSLTSIKLLVTTRLLPRTVRFISYQIKSFVVTAMSVLCIISSPIVNRCNTSNTPSNRLPQSWSRITPTRISPSNTSKSVRFSLPNVTYTKYMHTNREILTILAFLRSTILQTTPFLLSTISPFIPYFKNKLGRGLIACFAR